MARQEANYAERIIIDPEIMAGKPVVKGTRIPVEKVLEQLAYEPDLHELLAIYPELTVEDVRACLAYAKAAIVPCQRLATPLECSGRDCSHLGD